MYCPNSLKGLNREDLLASLKAWETNLAEYQQIQNEYMKTKDHEGVQFAQGFIDIARNGIANTKRYLAKQ